MITKKETDRQTSIKSDAYPAEEKLAEETPNFNAENSGDIALNPTELANISQGLDEGEVPSEEQIYVPPSSSELNGKKLQEASLPALENPDRQHSEDLVLDLDDEDDDLPLPDNFRKAELPFPELTEEETAQTEPPTPDLSQQQLPQIETETLDLSQQQLPQIETETLDLSQQQLAQTEEATLDLSQQQLPQTEEATLDLSQQLPEGDLSDLSLTEEVSAEKRETGDEAQSATIALDKLPDEISAIALSSSELSNIATDTEEKQEERLGDERSGIEEKRELESEEKPTKTAALATESREDSAPGADMAGTMEEIDQSSLSLSLPELHKVMEDIEEPAHGPTDKIGAPSSTQEEMPLLEKPPSFNEVTAGPLLSDSISEKLAAEEGLNRQELRKMITYLDRLFDQLPEETVREFGRSEYFDLYKKIMNELGV